MSGGFEARAIDDDPVLLEQSYRLRYQVYCVERLFLRAEDYPDGLEYDAFDRDSIHVGAVDGGGVAATARIVKPSSAGLPLFRYCTLFPHVTTLEDTGNMVVEVSRVSISRQYARRPDDTAVGGIVVPGAGAHPSVPVTGDRRRRRGEPFLTLLKAIYQGVKRLRATHVIGATDQALHRWLIHYGLPYRLAGPETDYYGAVSPYIMSLAELDQVVLGGHFAALDDFLVGLEHEFRPRRTEREGDTVATNAAGPLFSRSAGPK
jgi:N-acyl amino acid synthase of PEP-CTERM/exosortase system